MKLEFLSYLVCLSMWGKRGLLVLLSSFPIPANLVRRVFLSNKKLLSLPFNADYIQAHFLLSCHLYTCTISSTYFVIFYEEIVFTVTLCRCHQVRKSLRLSWFHKPLHLTGIYMHLSNFLLPCGFLWLWFWFLFCFVLISVPLGFILHQLMGLYYRLLSIVAVFSSGFCSVSQSIFEY